MSIKIDKTDRRIIEFLSKDARRSLTQLARKVGISRPTLISRLERLMRENLIGINVGLNLEKLGLLTAFVFLEVFLEIKGVKNQTNLERTLMECPRVISAFKLEEKANLLLFIYGEDKRTLLLLIYGEDKRTLNAFINSLRDFPSVEIISVMHSESPLFDEKFPIRVYSEKMTSAPCERKCGECFRFKDASCVGCPAVIEYKGII